MDFFAVFEPAWAFWRRMATESASEYTGCEAEREYFVRKSARGAVKTYDLVVWTEQGRFGGRRVEE